MGHSRIGQGILLAVACVMISASAVVFAEKPTLAIVDFEVINVDAGDRWGRELADLVRADDALNEKYSVLSGELLRQSKTDLRRLAQGTSDARNTSAAPNLLQVQLVVSGTVVRFTKTIRVDFTLLDTLTRKMCKCREVFAEEQSKPNRLVAKAVSQSILAASAGNCRSAKVVVAEEFTGEALDPAFWTITHEELESDEDCEQRYHHVIENDHLLLNAEAVSARGWFSGQQIHLESTKDLRDGHDYVIDIEFSVQSLCCGLDAMIVADHNKSAQQGYGFAQLFGCGVNVDHPAPADRTRLRIEISGDRQSAMVFSNRRHEPEAACVDLSALKRWNLQIGGSAGASTGRPKSSMTMKIHRVRIVRIEPGTGIFGRVMNRDTQRPIPAAVVRVASLDWQTQSGPAGLFAIPCPPGKYRIDAEMQDFSSPEMPPVNVSDTTKSRVDVALKRTTFHEGDLISAIPLTPICKTNEQPGKGLTTDGNRLFFTLGGLTQCSQRHRLCSISFDGTELADLGTFPTDGALGFLDGKFYHTVRDPATIYRCLPDWTLYRPVREWSVFGIQALAYGEKYVWSAAGDGFRGVYLLIAHDPQSLRPIRHIDATGHEISGIACDGSRMWASDQSGNGEIIEIDIQKAWRDMTLRNAIKKRFPGNYLDLTYADGSLWGTSGEWKQICRIYIPGPPGRQE